MMFNCRNDTRTPLTRPQRSGTRWGTRRPLGELSEFEQQLQQRESEDALSLRFRLHLEGYLCAMWPGRDNIRSTGMDCVCFTALRAGGSGG